MRVQFHLGADEPNRSLRIAGVGGRHGKGHKRVGIVVIEHECLVRGMDSIEGILAVELNETQRSVGFGKFAIWALLSVFLYFASRYFSILVLR